MEFLEKAQTLLVQNALYVGVGLLVAVLLAATVWFYMGRNSAASGSKDTLMNQARMNMVTTDMPAGASHPDPSSPPPQSQEELERQLASIGNIEAMQQQQQQQPNSAEANE